MQDRSAGFRPAHLLDCCSLIEVSLAGFAASLARCSRRHLDSHCVLYSNNHATRCCVGRRLRGYTAILVSGMDRLENDCCAPQARYPRWVWVPAARRWSVHPRCSGSSVWRSESAAAAYMLIHMLGNRLPPPGRVFTLRALGLIARVDRLHRYAERNTPWYALPILAAIPAVCAWLNCCPESHYGSKPCCHRFRASALAAGAAYVTWRAAGDVPFEQP